MCGVTWIPQCARDGSVIAWGRGEGETWSIHVVSTQCASGLKKLRFRYFLSIACYNEAKYITDCVSVIPIDDLSNIKFCLNISASSRDTKPQTLWYSLNAGYGTWIAN